MAGWPRGFDALEQMERISVGLKLAIIAGLLFGLGWRSVSRMAGEAFVISPATVTGWSAVTLAAGLLVTVEGFETSRYLGEECSARNRIRSMRIAQWVSSAIYMIYILFLSLSFAPDALELSETAIIDLMAIVAPILLIVAEISAQFSAAVADTGGSGAFWPS